MRDGGTERRVWTWGLALVPVATATGLALLYAIGALVKTTQLLGADVPVREALPLVPLQHLLQVGIGTVASIPATLLGLVVLTVVAVAFDPRRRAKAGTGPAATQLELPRGC